MVDRFDSELLRFEQEVRAGTARVKVARAGGGGGGSLDWTAVLLLAAAAVLSAERRRRATVRVSGAVAL
jgi:hypothetical protein